MEFPMGSGQKVVHYIGVGYHLERVLYPFCGPCPDSPALCRRVGTSVGPLHGVGSRTQTCLLVNTGQGWSHALALSGRLRHAGRGGGHGVGIGTEVGSPTGPRAQASPGGHGATGLPRALAVHGAIGVHAQTVAHARAGAAVVGTGGPAVVRGSGVVTWRDRE